MSSERFLDEKWLKKLDREMQVLFDREGTDRKTLDEVFDKPTLDMLGKLISDGVIDILDFPISTGKEGNVFRGVTPDKKFVALKIYRTSTSTFKHMSNYIIGDPRFKAAIKNRREVVYEWAKKEYKNLEILHEIGVRAPVPIKRIRNILVMEYIGDSSMPAPMLKDAVLINPKKIFDILIDYIFKMYRKAALIHGDLSMFNVLMHKNRPYIIDVGQGVLKEHPLACDFLKRDIHNVVHYFKKYGITANEEEIYDKIIKC
ncbi:MAG: serine protein kinase RIO [Candidatus Thermoplasmatota archaeon]|jgi:RIO kinase 1|nr:serine protein kinase RIO [Candidatus Thermoplasmatota archaeon]